MCETVSMAYVFYDLPADSADLETFNGYHVTHAATVARGGPAKKEDPFSPPEELVLSSHRQPWFAPAARRMRMSAPLARRVPSRAWCLRGFISTREAASLLSVPSLCFLMVWLIGRFW
jgi:hypothetical protein